MIILTKIHKIKQLQFVATGCEKNYALIPENTEFLLVSSVKYFIS